MNADSAEPELSTKPSAVPEVMTLAERLKWLVLVQVAFGLIVLPVVYLAGADVATAALAWLACAVGAIGGHLASEYPEGVEFVLLRLASGMACRTLLPMAFAIWGAKFREPAVDKTAMLVLVFAYMVGLVVDSVLSLRRIKPVVGDSD